MYQANLTVFHFQNKRSHTLDSEEFPHVATLFGEKRFFSHSPLTAVSASHIAGSFSPCWLTLIPRLSFRCNRGPYPLPWESAERLEAEPLQLPTVSTRPALLYQLDSPWVYITPLSADYSDNLPPFPQVFCLSSASVYGVFRYCVVLACLHSPRLPEHRWWAGLFFSTCKPAGDVRGASRPESSTTQTSLSSKLHTHTSSKEVTMGRQASSGETYFGKTAFYLRLIHYFTQQVRSTRRSQVTHAGAC